MPTQYFSAPHKNQTLVLHITDALIAALEDYDGLPAHLHDAYESGHFGNKFLLMHLRELRQQGREYIAGTVSEHVEAIEVTDSRGNLVMVISSEDECSIEWKGPWVTDPHQRGTVLNPTYFTFSPIELAPEPINA